jgi:hypothetical protein
MRAERVAQNERLFRRLNEQIRRVERPSAHETLDAVCECADQSCFLHLSIPVAEYERLRRNPRRFAIAPGHEVAELETVVDRYDGYIVVEKPETN